ncbi:hypothetical protein N3K66_000385 [Trichothecium roseum]|uniref:Uncharacterized protein n=1 Tax=Trichothecium roseum TaxID=47278 RepID=A0ACC0VBR2_9HYPO|nr:hypothetical protein N3K66_000385 [Trichothecium roseum]
MSSNTDNNNDDGQGQDTSYKMTDLDDASLVGKHCEYEYCNQLDFLPFHCQSCGGTFCLDHRGESAHRCASEGAWAERRRLARLAEPSVGAGRTLRDVAVAEEKPCALSPSCRAVVGTSLAPGVHCRRCRRDYCLKHRLEEDHDCKNLTPLGARAPSSADVAAKTKSALDRFKAWGLRQKESATRALPKPKPTSAAARLAAVNALKKTAKGDAKLPAEKRVYLHVEAEAATARAKYPRGDFFYSRDWVVGRVLDAAARSLQVENLNNRSEAEADKLRVFHVEAGRLLDYGEKVGAALQSGNTVVLLRGVGPPPDLIDV